VSLLNVEGICIGEGWLSTMKAGDILHTSIVREDKVTVYITNIILFLKLFAI
jgi:hypothetical protein